jgi:hypothetical protein
LASCCFVNMQICAVVNLQMCATLPFAYRYNAFAHPVARSLAYLLPADIPRSEPPEEYVGSFVSFVVLDNAGDTKPASAKKITDWVEHKSADFCRLTSTEVPICPCKVCCHLCDHNWGTSLHVQPVMV